MDDFSLLDTSPPATTKAVDVAKLGCPPALELICTRKRGPKGAYTRRVARVLCNYRLHPGVLNELKKEARQLGTSETALLEAIVANHFHDEAQRAHVRHLVDAHS